MALDAATLFTVTTSVTGLLGVFLLVAWVQERSVRALAWWGGAYLMGGSAVALWGTQETTGAFASELSNALLFVACGMIWNGARLFHGRAVLTGGLLAGGIGWVAVMQVAAFAQSNQARIVLSSLIIASYVFLTALELRRDRRKAHLARPLLIVVPLLHGAVFLSPIPLSMLWPAGGSADGWFALFALETLFYVVGTAFIVVVMAKERIAQVHKTAAMTDMLTGLFNRRAFFETAQQMIAQQARMGAPVRVLVFDLDNFKSVNDRFGHAVGDDALKLFAATASASMRTTDVIGRLGGEEFVAILPGTMNDAVLVAERVRQAFQAAGVEISGHQIGSTVSIGAASAVPPTTIEPLIARADEALYSAKKNGRNRVVMADAAAPSPAAETVPPIGAPALALP